MKLNTDLLLRLGDSIKTGWELCGSKWRKGETELIALQTLSAAANNFREKGEAFSWAGKNSLSGRQNCGTNNAAGVDQLLEDGSLILEEYSGDLQPSNPQNIAQKDGKFLVFRPTNNLIFYAASVILRD